jgi:fructose-bisphosphate aldolase class II
MMVNTKEILLSAREKKYAVPHLNINNLEWTKYILEICDELRSPVILGVSEGAAKYMGGYITVCNLVNGLIEDKKITIPVCLHLDHGKSFEACKKAIDAGFTSVMIDASSNSLQENIELTKQVVIYAHNKNVTVEAEVGHIGGSEDSSNSDIAYAKLEDCINLVNSTGIDSLAPALGSVHGLYNGEAKIDLDRMAVIRNNINVPLVLHGGTGISDQIISQSIRTGICKVNINTELQVAWAQAVREKIRNDLNVYDPRKIIGSGEQALKDSVREKILLFGSNNRY